MFFMLCICIKRTSCCYSRSRVAHYLLAKSYLERKSKLHGQKLILCLCKKIMKNHKWEGKSDKKGVFTYIFLSTVLRDAWTKATQQKLRSWEVHVCRGWILSLVLTPTDNLPFHLYVGLLVFPSLLSMQIFSGFNEFHWSSFVGMIRFLLINYVCSQHVHILQWATTLCVLPLFFVFLFFLQQNQNWP